MCKRGLAATLPGVRVGSSVGSFKVLPFHALPGTNSGIPKSLESSVGLLLGFVLSLLSGQPEPATPLFPLDQVLPPSRRTFGEGCDVELLLEPGALKSILNINFAALCH